MGRKQPFVCPVIGCRKRGSLSDLARHAKVKHPEISANDYAYAATTRHVLRGRSANLSPPGISAKTRIMMLMRPRASRLTPNRRKAVKILSIGLSGALCILVLVLAVQFEIMKGPLP